MPKNMLSEALREIRGLLTQLLANLEGEQGEKWLAEFKKFLRKEKCWASTVFELVDTVKFPVTLGIFFARGKFVKDISRKAKVKISCVGDNFTEWFLGKVEEAIVETELRYARLLKASRDEQIRVEIGDQVEETALSHMYALMEKQANGENGTLLTDGYANIFYIRDANGTLRVVIVGWDGDGWHVDARSVGDPDGWGEGRQVFCRNSSVPQNK